jgi:hypothetical protein
MTVRRKVGQWKNGEPLPVEHLDEHAFGLELELTELNEQWRRALIQQRTADAARLASELDSVRDELVDTADRAADLAVVRHRPVIRAERARPAA